MWLGGGVEWPPYSKLYCGGLYHSLHSLISSALTDRVLDVLPARVLPKSPYHPYETALCKSSLWCLQSLDSASSQHKMARAVIMPFLTEVTVWDGEIRVSLKDIGRQGKQTWASLNGAFLFPRRHSEKKSKETIGIGMEIGPIVERERPKGPKILKSMSFQ